MKPSSRSMQVVICAAGLLAVGLLAGCNVSVPVEYSPLAATDSLVKPGAAPGSVFVVRFLDERKDGEKIGNIRNAFGTSVKGVVTSTDLGTLMAEASTDALNKAGLKAALHSERTTGASIPPGELTGYDLVIGGRLTHLDVDVLPKFSNVDAVGKVTIDVAVTRNGQIQWVGPIEGTARKEIPVVMYTDITAVANLAIQDCMKNMVRHLKASGSFTQP